MDKTQCSQLSARTGMPDTGSKAQDAGPCSLESMPDCATSHNPLILHTGMA